MSNVQAKTNRVSVLPKIVAAAWQQLRTLYPLLLLIYVPTLLVFAVLVAVNLATKIPLRYFFIDPVTEFNAPMYIGLLSNFGVLLWCGSAAICLLTGWMVFKEGKRREVAWFLIGAAAVTALLMVDDLYLLHEEVLPDHAHIPQILVFVAYGGLMLAFLFRFARTILSTDFVLLLISFAFFATSIFVDIKELVTPEDVYIAQGILGLHILIEDGTKLMGIITYTVYFLRVCLQAVQPLLQSTGSRLTPNE